MLLKVDIDNISIQNNHDKHTVLKSIGFELLEGKIYTILGKNGSGKSTLIKSLTGLLNNNLFNVQGEAIIGNNNILQYNIDELQRIRLNEIRYVFQDAVNSFDPLKIFKYYFDNSPGERKRTDELLKYFLLPDYSEISSLYPYEVSGGMAQRLGFILAFLANPKLLILDEPTSSIDYAIANLLLIKLKEFTEWESRSVLIVTHNIGFAKKVSDELAFLANGTMTKFKSKNDFFIEQDIVQLNSFMNAYKEMQ